MPKAEIGSAIYLKNPDIFESYPQLLQLYSNSVTGRFVNNDPSCRIRHIASQKMIDQHQIDQLLNELGSGPVYRSVQQINGTLGLELLDSESDKGVAVCGYRMSLLDNRPFFQMTHTPQGRLPPHGIFYYDSLSRKERRRLVNSQFRENMVDTLVTVARSVDACGISIVSARNHPKVIAGEIGFDFAEARMDMLAKQCGFERCDDGNFWKFFSK